MNFINIEIKAKCFHPGKVEAFLLAQRAHFEGIDYQRDTYFNVLNGRLKLRVGNIENNLIFYQREDKSGPKRSDFRLVKIQQCEPLESILSESLGVKVVVKKKRKVFYLSNIKIHLDEVPLLGNFVEIEASNYHDINIHPGILREQCENLIRAFDLKKEDLIESSYSDMLLQLKN